VIILVENFAFRDNGNHARMSDFLRQRAAAHSHDSIPANSPKNSPSKPWYGEDALEATDMPKELKMADLNQNIPEANASPEKRPRSSMLSEVDLLDAALSSVALPVLSISEPKSIVHDERLLADLNHAISQVELIVKSVNSRSDGSQSPMCKNCEFLEKETSHLKQRIEELEHEVNQNTSGKREEPASGREKPPGGASLQTSPALLSASMRLRSVTQALNKALQSKK
jgi:hypothetical protein